MRNNRNNRIDFYKALLMFSVVWGHTINVMLNGEECGCNISWFLRTYDMPMFMLISGFFLKYSMERYDVITLLLNKTSYILFPAIFWSLLVSAGHKPHTLYFLWSIYLSTVIITLIELLSNQYIKGCLYFGLISVLHLVDCDFVNMSYLFPFFLMGYYWKTLDRNLHFGIIFVYIILVCFWETDYTIWSAGAYVLDHPVHMIKVVGLRFAIGFAGIFSMKIWFDIFYSYLNPFFFGRYDNSTRLGG